MPAIQNISDTARWVAVYRAMESERADALFHDPYARLLAGEKGEAIVREVPGGRSMAWPMVVRTKVLDEMIMDAVERQGADMVLNLAAGLDTRPYRMALPPSLQWVEVDLPAILAWKREHLGSAKPVCRFESVDLDLTDEVARRALFTRLSGQAQRVLVVTEGLLVYLLDEQVASLARDLHSAPTFRWWLMDLASPRLLKMLARRWGKTLQAGNSPMRFAPANGPEFFRPQGWQLDEFHSMMEEAQRLKREMSFAWLWRAIGRLYPARLQEEFRRMSGLVKLARV